MRKTEQRREGWAGERKMRRDTDGKDVEKGMCFYCRKSIGFTVRLHRVYKSYYKVSCSCSFTMTQCHLTLLIISKLQICAILQLALLLESILVE